MNQKLLFLCFTILLIQTFSCSDDTISNSSDTYDRGEIIEIESTGSYSANDIKNILTGFDPQATFPLEYAVKSYRIVYQTIDFNGNFMKVSGAVMVPQTNIALPLLSIQHGTETRRDFVASVNPFNSVEGVTGLLTASMGYFTAVPDYPGFGVSKTLHPYLHSQSLAISVIDFLRAARIYCVEQDVSLNEQLFLTGYSEGGYVTLATQKEIEENYFTEFSITAVAPAAGPYDLYETSKQIFQKDEYIWPAYMAFVLTAYNDIYNWDALTEIFKPAFSGLMVNLFDGEQSTVEINNQLPKATRDLFTEGFIESIVDEADNKFVQAINENTLLDWTPIAPLHFFHGDADQTVPYENTLTAYERFSNNGAQSIEMTIITGGTHSTASLPFVIGMLTWFESFKSDVPEAMELATRSK